MRRKRTNFDESARNNNINYLYYYQRLKELSISMFEWKNLPDSCDPRFLELTLFEDGQAVFFKDEVLGYLCLQCVINGKLNVYRIPMRRRAFAVNGYNKDLNQNDSVIIYNNMIRTNCMMEVQMFARRLWDLDRTIDVNARAQKTPVLVTAPEQQRLSLLNAYKELDGNSPVIFGDSGLNKDAISVLSTGAPYVADKIYQLKTQIWNEALTYLGISNLNIQKKERLVSDEVTRNMGGTIASRYSRLESRRQAVDAINKMFGLDIEVNYREDFREQDDEVMLKQDTEDHGDVDIMRDLRTR